MRKPIISVMEGTWLAKDHFGLTIPMTLEQLKKAYRKRAMELHPDKGGTTQGFQEMQDAYTKLTRCMELFDESAMFKATNRTVDGKLLVDLGLGFGPTINGTPCTRCETKGYSITFDLTYVPCTDCDEYGIPFKERPCLECKGTGRFTQRNKRQIECRRCKGTGKVKTKQSMKEAAYRRYYSTYGSICGSCGGTRRKAVDNKERPVYHTCRECGGVGEIRIWNPVISKGRLA